MVFLGTPGETSRYADSHENNSVGKPDYDYGFSIRTPPSALLLYSFSLLVFYGPPIFDSVIS